MKNCQDPYLSTKVDEVWKKAYDEGIFHLLDGILYHRTENTCVMTLTNRFTIKSILNECHDSAVSEHLSEDRTLEGVENALGGQIGEGILKDISRHVMDDRKKIEAQARNLE
ncbi:hypothetical protein O181_060654 [Austropuccinia psidii MF-1]|uniref:Uncharacterized protein n=1 Tax=Austropuccinia psidii MF-1 TaxID=1389203 RepID=A0A9Q3EGR8_9BASI|nr:hypothetical protein [Austropuccinia psidii MF-1]